MPGEKTFLDTNILVYAYDVSAGEKHDIAREIVIRLWDSGLGCVSTQVLQELFVILTGKIPKPLQCGAATEIVKDFMTWDVIVNDESAILEAIEIHLKYKYSFWDSMIIGSATRSNASSLMTEDLAHGQVIDNLTIRNPFLTES